MARKSVPKMPAKKRPPAASRRTKQDDDDPATIEQFQREHMGIAAKE